MGKKRNKGKRKKSQKKIKEEIIVEMDPEYLKGESKEDTNPLNPKCKTDVTGEIEAFKEIKMSKDLYLKIMAITEYFGEKSLEWGALLKARELDDCVEVYDIVILDQIISSASIDFADGALRKYMRKHCEDEDYKNLHGWIHSHHNLGLFWSTTDDQCCETLGVLPNGKDAATVISIVFGCGGNFVCRVDFFATFGHVMLNEVPVTVGLESEEEITDEEWEKKFKEYSGNIRATVGDVKFKVHNVRIVKAKKEKAGSEEEEEGEFKDIEEITNETVKSYSYGERYASASWVGGVKSFGNTVSTSTASERYNRGWDDFDGYGDRYNDEDECYYRNRDTRDEFLCSQEDVEDYISELVDDEDKEKIRGIANHPANCQCNVCLELGISHRIALTSHPRCCYCDHCEDEQATLKKYYHG